MGAWCRRFTHPMGARRDVGVGFDPYPPATEVRVGRAGVDGCRRLIERGRAEELAGDGWLGLSEKSSGL